MQNCIISNSRSGIVQVLRHRAPKLADEVIRDLGACNPVYITRHIEERFLESARKGYFQFGTLVGYRAKEGAITGRLGDHQESRLQEIFNSRSGFFEKASLEGIEILNTSITGTERQIVVETIVNDYCSCSSIGEFDLIRGNAIRDHESDSSKKPGAYVTYHLPTLRAALDEHFAREDEFSGFALVGQNVDYGEKDRKWNVEESFRYQRDRDALAIWLGIAFVKSQSFMHEEEYRLLLTDPSGPGGLSDHAKYYIIAESDAIAASIKVSDSY